MNDEITAQPNWLQRAVVYQIFPRSFYDANGDGNGDLKGIIEKLDYLNDGTDHSLGVDAIWINPIYVSPMEDSGYDIADHYRINPMFGDMETFDLLVSEIHERGMKILIDFVPNHTSSEHPWFLESRSSPDNPKRDWYIWQDPKPDGSPPNNWLTKFGDSAWTYDEKTEQYYLHKYLPEQPDLNWRNKEVRAEMRNVLRFWLDRGVDGFRTDAINHLIEDESFTDDPPNPNYDPGRDKPYDALLHVHTRNRPENFITMNLFCQVLEEYEDRYMVSEAHVGPEDMVKFYHACPTNHIVPFNFNLVSLPWSALEYKTFIDGFEHSLHGKHWPNYVLGNHDLSRLATRLGQKRARVATMLLFTLRGTPFVYYGDEIGMEDGAVPSDYVHDPWEIAVPGFKLGRDPERTPMQWNDKTYAGFSIASPWLPVGGDYPRVNVAAQESDPRSMLELHKRLIRLRKGNGALKEGAYEAAETDAPGVLAFYRCAPDKRMLVVLNFEDKKQTVAVKTNISETARVACNIFSDKEEGDAVDLSAVHLEPYEGYILEIAA